MEIKTIHLLTPLSKYVFTICNATALSVLIYRFATNSASEPTIYLFVVMIIQASILFGNLFNLRQLKFDETGVFYNDSRANFNDIYDFDYQIYQGGRSGNTYKVSFYVKQDNGYAFLKGRAKCKGKDSTIRKSLLEDLKSCIPLQDFEPYKVKETNNRFVVSGPKVVHPRTRHRILLLSYSPPMLQHIRQDPIRGCRWVSR
jgi:hypothetical protein